MLKLPILGKLNHMIALARFSRTLSTLMASGVPILQALETVAGAIDNEVISGALLTRATPFAKVSESPSHWRAVNCSRPWCCK